MVRHSVATALRYFSSIFVTITINISITMTMTVTISISITITAITIIYIIILLLLLIFSGYDSNQADDILWYSLMLNFEYV